MHALTNDDLDRLELFLCRQDDDVMLLSELDGYLTGVLVCPDLILPGEWMPLIWGEAGAPFQDVEEANDILGLIMGLYNDIIRRMGRPDSYGPLIAEDLDGSFLWELWALGFGKAVSLRPAAWTKLERRSPDDPASTAFRGLAALAIRAQDMEVRPERRSDLDEELSREAPDMIAACVLDLHHDRIASRAPGTAAPGVGRNDPCPCGSGRKFKRCCLAADHH